MDVHKCIIFLDGIIPVIRLLLVCTEHKAQMGLHANNKTTSSVYFRTFTLNMPDGLLISYNFGDFIIIIRQNLAMGACKMLSFRAN